MKRIVCICVVLLCLASFAFAQGEDAGLKKTKKPIVKKKTVGSPFAEAEKAWIPFYEKFREIVKNRDRQGLYNAMAEDFDFRCAYNGGNGYQGEGVGRSFEIKKFDSNSDPAYDCGGWKKLVRMNKVSRLLKKGDPSGWGIKRTPSRIIGEYWNNRTKEACSPNDGREDWALFEFRAKKWFFVQLGFCEGE